MAKKLSASSSKRTSSSTTKMKAGGAKKSLKRFQGDKSGSQVSNYTMKDYLADYPSASPSDTLAQSNPAYGGIKYFGTGKQQAALEKAHTTKYGNPTVGMKAAAPPLTGTKLDADIMKQYKKGGATSKKTMMKKGDTVKKKK